jgi:hypothetical protein
MRTFSQRLAAHRRTFLWIGAALAAFAFGRHFAERSVDFIVYYNSAMSLLAGRTDLYSDTFSLGPPAIYLYPPLFVLLIFPLGWLSFSNAYGIWFALLVLATAAVIRQACLHWRPQRRATYALLLATLAGPYVVIALRYGNVHLFVVLLTILGVLAWSRGRVWTASAALAVGGAVKIFPLFLLPVLAVRREWGLAARVVAFSALLWMLPVVYFGPRETVSLYRSWYEVVARNTDEFKKQHALDHSLEGALERWFTRVDYSEYHDPDYPQATVVELPRGVVETGTTAIRLAILALSLWMCVLLRRASERAREDFGSNGNPYTVTAGAVFISAQLLLGPYTNILYLSGWLLLALASPVVLRGEKLLERVMLAAGVINALLFAVPGRTNQRAIAAAAVYGFVGIILWTAVMLGARARTSKAASTATS